MSKILFSLLCGSIAFIVPLNSNSQSFREQFTEANLLSEDGYHGMSISIWKKLAEQQPSNANIQYKLGLSYLKQGVDRYLALPYLRSAAQKVERMYDPFSSDIKTAPVEVYYYLGKAYHLNNKLDSADACYQKFLLESGKKHFLRASAEKELVITTNARELMARPVDVIIMNMGDSINSEYAEYAPVLSYDENTMYFTSRRKRADGSNEGSIENQTGLYFENMYVSYRNIDGVWTSPELLSINAPDRHSSVVSISPNGRSIYIYKIFSGNGNIYQSDLQEGIGWTEPGLVGSDVNSEYNEYFASITADGQRLYFVSDRKGGYGGKDIWYCQLLPNGEWGQALNLGEQINTKDDEDTPFLHPDGKTMYFASTGHKTIGGYDIFRTQLSESGTWSVPENVGYPINTTDDDHCFVSSPDGKRAYYSSRGQFTLGATDIYTIEYAPEAEKVVDVDVSAFAVLKGWVLPSGMNELPQGLRINIQDSQEATVLFETIPVKRNGSFVFIIPTGKSYTVNVLLNDRTVYSEQVEVPSGSQYQELSREIFIIQELQSTRVVALKDNVLDNVLKWKISLNHLSKGIPLGSKVLYMDEKDNVIDTAYISQDGYFEFKKLTDNKPYILKPILEGVDNDLVILTLLDHENEMRPLRMIMLADTFYEKGREPQITKRETSAYRMVDRDGKTLLAEGTTVKFLNERNEVVYTEIVKSDGSFLYHYLPDQKDFKLEIVLAREGHVPYQIQEILSSKIIRTIPLHSINAQTYSTVVIDAVKPEVKNPDEQAEYDFKLTLKNRPEVPAGSVVKFMGENDAVLFTEVVRSDGRFNFHKLTKTSHFLVVLSEAFSDSIWIEERYKGKIIKRHILSNIEDLTYRSAFLIEKSMVESAKESSLKKKELTEFKIGFDFNEILIGDQETIIQAVEYVTMLVKSGQHVTLQFSAGSSTLLTSYPGGNRALALERLKQGKIVFIKALEKSGIDMNMISTTRDEVTVSGPAYNINGPATRDQYSVFQFFKISIH